MARTLVWVHSRLRRTDISISRPVSSSSTDFTIEGDISPSLADPALLSVVGVVDGQFAGFITKERMIFIYTSTERTGPGFSAFKALVDRPVQRTRPVTSYPVSQSRVLPTNHEAGHVFSPTRKVGSAFFRTHVYCDYSPCFADPAWLSVVGFCGL